MFGSVMANHVDVPHKRQRTEAAGKVRMAQLSVSGNGQRADLSSSQSVIEGLLATPYNNTQLRNLIGQAQQNVASGVDPDFNAIARSIEGYGRGSHYADLGLLMLGGVGSMAARGGKRLVFARGGERVKELEQRLSKISREISGLNNRILELTVIYDVESRGSLREKNGQLNALRSELDANTDRRDRLVNRFNRLLNLRASKK